VAVSCVDYNDILLVLFSIDCCSHWEMTMSFPPSLYHIFLNTNPSHISEPFFTPLSHWLTVKQFVRIGLHESDTLLSQIYFIFLRVVMYGYLKDYFLIDHTCRMIFSVEVAMVEETEVEVIGTKAQEGPGSLYIFMFIYKILANCFMSYYSIGLGRE